MSERLRRERGSREMFARPAVESRRGGYPAAMSSEGSPVVVRTAATPAEAKVLAAILQAEGIPAIVDGESLADEIAISRRVMNLNGVQIRVPAAALERAREILGAAQVDPDELERQALAAESPETPPSSQPRGALIPWPLATAIAAAAAMLCFVLWQQDSKLLSAYQRRTRAEPIAGGWRFRDVLTNRVLYEVFGTDTNGPEIMRMYGADGTLLRVQRDDDGDRDPDQVDEYLPHHLQLRWTRRPGERQLLQLEVLGADHAVLRRQHFEGANGFVDVR